MVLPLFTIDALQQTMRFKEIVFNCHKLLNYTCTCIINLSLDLFTIGVKQYYMRLKK